jgi:hypothetical protein
MVLGAVASALYIVDAHRKFRAIFPNQAMYVVANVMIPAGDISVEAFTCLLVFKNIFSFGLTWSAYDWLVKYDVKPVFMIVAHVQVVICCLSVPMCKHPRPTFHLALLTRRRYIWEEEPILRCST